MLLKRCHRILSQGFLILVLLGSIGLVAACESSGSQTALSSGFRTWLLVQPPQGPLPVNRPVNVRSRTEDSQYKVSHVELYLVEFLPKEQSASPLSNVLIRADRAPFDQTTFTASQVFVPSAAGHYVVKVVGYNKRGQTAVSDYIGFDVE
jgi:hypothetical protein